jgi:hypothetical protein
MLLKPSQGGCALMRNLNWFTGLYGRMLMMVLRDIRIDHVFDDACYLALNIGANSARVYGWTPSGVTT